MPKTLSFVLICLGISCNSERKQKVEIYSKESFYKQSEMAALMLWMYDVNAANKQLILEGKSPKHFPKDFLKIHTAQLTDSTDRTLSFKAFSDYYIRNMKAVFESSQESLTRRHNTVINSCISCHQTICIGPIPKIKKLLIK
ncbi:MAG: hypothetical protein P8H13_03450 [Polaribacter sp.]|nr:hypothetical protein [Polaribacter sp.]MDG1810980.1 hypothetical protein [Polaribacter sp.]MDG1993979.1 hypothetical protein [Polaribacter sp.]